MRSSIPPRVPRRRPRPWAGPLVCLGLSFWSGPLGAAEFLPPGFRPIPPGTHALTGAHVIPKPGQSLNPGTVVIRDGLIAAVGQDIPIPKDARQWDLKGLTLYAGLIDAYLDLNPTNPPASNPASQPDGQEPATSTLTA